MQLLYSKFAVVEPDFHFVGQFTFKLFLKVIRFIHVFYKVVSLQLSKVGPQHRKILPHFRFVLVDHKLIQKHCWWLYFNIIEFAKI